MKNEQIIEDRLEKITQMLETVNSFLDELDIAIPKQAKKAIIDIMESDEIKSIVEDIKTRRPPKIVIMGRSGVGKSSLINAMFGTYLAETSAVEVGTVEHDIFQYKKNGKVIFEIIDTRGIKENINELSHTAEEDLKNVIEDFEPDAFLFLTNGADRSGLKEDAEELKRTFGRMSIKPPLITVITRMDELEPSRIKDPKEYTDLKRRNLKQKEQQVERVLKEVGLAETFIVPVSSYVEWSHEDPESLSMEEREQLTIEFDGRYNIDALFDVLEDNIDFNAAIDLMFNYKIDKAIEKIADTFIKRFSAASAVVGATPIPVADVFILLPIQIVEVVLIAYLSGNQVDAKTAREFIVSLGAVFIFGFGLRFAAQQGSKLLNIVPGAGSAISGTVAYSGTYSIGKAATAYYIKGQSLNEAKKEAEAAKEEIETLGKKANNDEKEAYEIEEKYMSEEENEPKQGEKNKEKVEKKVNLNKNRAKDAWNQMRTKFPWKKK